jgi:hypothetical protein
MGPNNCQRIALTKHPSIAESAGYTLVVSVEDNTKTYWQRRDQKAAILYSI